MTPTNYWKRSTALTTVFGVITAILSVSTGAAAATTRQAVQSSTSGTLLPGNQGELELAQSFPNRCAAVVPPNGLYVRREPSVYSEAIGIVDYQSYLTTAEGGTETWVPISAPLKGYVWRAWVAPCHVVPEVEAVPGVEF